MNSTELEEKYGPRVEEPLRFKSIDTVNHKPHPFMIGTRHITHASDNCGGKLGDRTLNAIPCAAPHCTLMAADHTHDTVMFLTLARDCTSKEVQAVLLSFLEEAEKDGLSGIAFVETPEKFKINN